MGFIGDAVSDVGSAIGHQFGFGGGANQFHVDTPVNNFTARAPINRFQAGQADLAQTDYNGAIGQAMGAGTGGALDQQQSSFADQLRQQMAGNGPSLAQQQLQQALNQNQQMAASSIGSQRGINPAMAARMIGQNQAAAGQQAAGQSAMIRSQEQLNATGMLGSALAAQRGQQIQQQGQNTNHLGMLGGLQQGQNALNLSNFQGAQGLNAGVAAQNAGLASHTQDVNASVAAGNQGAALDAARINAGIAGQNANISSNAWGGLLGGVGSAAAAMFSAGGEVPSTIALDDPQSYIGTRAPLDKWGMKMPGKKPGGARPYGEDSFLTNDMTGGADSFGKGGVIPGKADKAGDSPANDDVPITASPGEIVLPRSVTQADDAPEKAAEFVRAIRRKKEKEQGPQGYGRVLAKQREHEQRLKLVEQKLMSKKEAAKIGRSVGDE